MHAVAVKGMRFSRWICLGVRLTGASRTSYKTLSHILQDGRAALGSPVHTSRLAALMLNAYDPVLELHAAPASLCHNSSGVDGTVLCITVH